jgi:hypothetical protein
MDKPNMISMMGSVGRSVPRLGVKLYSMEKGRRKKNK